MGEKLTKTEWAKKLCNYTEEQCEFVVVAYEDGHAVGKVEGFEEAMEKVLTHEAMDIVTDMSGNILYTIMLSELEALRKPEGGG